MHVPENPPDRCPACDAPYESVSRHAEGFVVNLLDNERYRRVCFRPVPDGEAGRERGDNTDRGGDRESGVDGESDFDGESVDESDADSAALDCYHHTHRQVGGSTDDRTVPDEVSDGES